MTEKKTDAIKAPEFLSGEGETASLMRSRDWSQSPLGPPENWPDSLKTVVRIMLASRYAIWIGWIPELAFLYNDAWAAEATPRAERHYDAAAGRPRLLHALCNDSDLRDVPVILLSARAGEEASVEGLKAGVEQLSKPFTLAQLSAKIRQMLNRAEG